MILFFDAEEAIDKTRTNNLRLAEASLKKVSRSSLQIYADCV